MLPVLLPQDGEEGTQQSINRKAAVRARGDDVLLPQDGKEAAGGLCMVRGFDSS